MAEREVSFLGPEEPIPGTAATVGEFWSWAFSDVTANATRGVLAEYLVGLALGVLDCPRLLWDAVDLRYRGHGIEVKSACATQAWPQKRPSPIGFSIAAARPWDALTNEYGTEATRSASAYVFAVATVESTEPRQMLNVEAWTFQAVSTQLLRSLSARKRVSANTLARLGQPVNFSGIRSAVDAALGVSAS